MESFYCNHSSKAALHAANTYFIGIGLDDHMANLTGKVVLTQLYFIFSEGGLIGVVSATFDQLELSTVNF
jgi:hypothetical protein